MLAQPHLQQPAGAAALLAPPASPLPHSQIWRCTTRRIGGAHRAPLRVCAQTQGQPWKVKTTPSSRGSSTVGRSATLTVEAVKTQQFTSFEDMVRASDVPVLVDFHATWCGPCKLMGDALRGIADDMKGKVSVVKIDTDKYPNIASRYGIKSLPTLLLFRDGRAVDRIEGLMPESTLAQRLRFYIGRLDLKFGRR